MDSPGETPLLFTPGPLTTSRSVKEAMLIDLGSRDERFLGILAALRHKLLTLAGAAEPEYAAILLSGSGTYAVEATLGSAVPPEGKLLAVINGAYGARIASLADALGIDTVRLGFDEQRALDPAQVAAALDADPTISHVALVHCETSTGLINPIAAVGELTRARGRSFIVDAMSSLGGIPVSLPAAHVDYLVSSANKCIEGVPGFAFTLARRDALSSGRGVARGTSLDLRAQLTELDRSGQFRFTPPTHAILACDRALEELAAEGGVAARAARYRRNQDVLAAGMGALGFRSYLPAPLQGPIITAFHCPASAGDQRFDFERFYRALSRRGFVIYPGKASEAATFRIGHIGHLDEREVTGLLGAIAAVLAELGLPTPLPR